MFRWFESLVDPYTAYQETDAPPTRLVPYLRSFSGPFRRVFAATAFITALVAITEVWMIWYLGELTDLLSGGVPAEIWAENWPEFIAVAVFILLIRPAVQVLNELILNHGVGVSWGTLIRWRVHRHVMRQSVGWFENDFAGRVANRVMQTPSAANEVAFQVFDAVAYAVTYAIGAAVLLSGADPRLLLPLLIWLALYAALMVWAVRNVAPRSKASSEARSQLNGRLVDGYTNIHSVKMFAHHDREIEYGREAIEEVRRTFGREMQVYSLMNGMLVFLNGVLIVGVVGWAMGLFFTGQASLGIVVAASALVLRLNGMTGWIMWAVTNLFQQLGIVAEGMQTTSAPVTLKDAPGAQDLEVTEGRIEIEHLSHHYGREVGGLDDVDLTVSPGEKVGLVGPSGAGKSTLVKLLLRFYDAESGQILIDGQDISSVTQESLRRSIGMVQQDSSLLHRSVRENILYGRPEASEDEVLAAARQAEANDFIVDLEDRHGNRGYDAQVGERGVKLSGGQRQRIALARVMLKDAPILVLDEATSALDSEVEAAIQETLYGLMEGKTVIAIAHRLSTIARMDRIVVMQDGRVIEDGPHEALLAQGGLYARLWARQSGGFLGETETEAAE
ncbi:ABC transporter ATP-binding protein [Histidinibacterium aquaticum]|uniref:ABC transporter ATP-binding protein n=1 Tax=Histidinibacterium aquaticum TaxID=2613962 RepID=A0A5J5GFE4_9RHOB|nr:ABC transporter ATP-binding protein [Histidinibacterium aquaticum]KAA9006895.1 ABC transporter ATP-binding protein [Histidinibacterium aquaticum]